MAHRRRGDRPGLPRWALIGIGVLIGLLIAAVVAYVLFIQLALKFVTWGS